MSIGFCSNDVDGSGRPDQQCVTERARQEQLTIDDAITNGTTGISNVIVMLSPSGTDISGASAVAKATTVLSNGIRLEWTNVDSIQYKITCILIGGEGDSFTDFLQMFTSTTGFTNTLVDGADGFLADMYFIVSFEGNFTPTGSNADSEMSFGFAARSGSTIQQASLTHFFQDNADPTVSKGMVKADRAVITLRSNEDYGFGEITQFNSDGFTIVGHYIDNAPTGGGSPSPAVAVLGIDFKDGLHCKVATHALTTGTGSKTYNSLGIRPQVVVAFSDLIATEGTLYTDATAGSVCASVFTENKEYAHSISHKQGLSLPNPPNPPSSTSALSRTDAKAIAILDENGSISQMATLTAMTTSGFTLNFSNASDAGHMIVLGIESYPPTP